MPRCPLDIRETRWIRDLEQLEPGTAHQHVFQVSNQLVRVLLADTEEVHDLAIEVVQNLDCGWFFVKKNLGSAAEYLDIGRMLGKHRDDLFSEAGLPADV